MTRFISRPDPAAPAWHAAFLAMLPAIAAQARFLFRRLRPEAREDAVQEVIANAVVAFARLVELRKADVAYPSVLARYAAAQVRDGRRVGNRINIREVLSPRAQKEKGFRVERLDRFDKEEDQWIEAVIEDRRTPVPDQVAFRLDFPAWLKRLSTRDRQIAETLALGHTTGEVAERFGLSPARISQLRRELHCSWLEFHGEASAEEPTARAT
jgi:hypothetical protein